VRAILFMLLLAAVTVARAETVYVSERQFVNLRGDFVDAALVVKRLESGAALEVLERTDLLWRVRDTQGAEGWIEPRLVGTAVPARLRVATLEKEIGQLKAALAAERDKLKGLEASLASQKEKLADTKEKLAAVASVPPPLPEPAVVGETKGFAFSLTWLAISFAMLGVGIIVGVIWIREGIRRRMGGMYLRV
jgi:uncharacterized coiled-coil protein SlyX